MVRVFSIFTGVYVCVMFRQDGIFFLEGKRQLEDHPSPAMCFSSKNDALTSAACIFSIFLFFVCAASLRCHLRFDNKKNALVRSILGSNLQIFKKWRYLLSGVHVFDVHEKRLLTMFQKASSF